MRRDVWTMAMQDEWSNHNGSNKKRVSSTVETFDWVIKNGETWVMSIPAYCHTIDRESLLSLSATWWKKWVLWCHFSESIIKICKVPSNLSWWTQVFLTVLMPGKLSKSPITGRRRRKLITTGKNPLKKIQRFCKLNVVRDEAIEFVMIFYHYQDIRMCLNTSVTNKTWISRWEPNFARSFCTHQNYSLYL